MSEPRREALQRFDHGESAGISAIVRFAVRRGCRKIGIATCGDSDPNAEALRARLSRAGLEVVSAAALQKAASVAEPRLPELPEPSETESRCDPAAQARLLNAEGSDFNVAVGLCMGCDSMFFREAEAPTTVLREGGIARDFSQLEAELV
ncbi:MAG TPA: DUF1847 domain-containing protein [Stellaceae bacterium]|nr:DUF1847 domain-containing protein [Stellaceae bacterium]